MSYRLAATLDYLFEIEGVDDHPDEGAEDAAVGAVCTWLRAHPDEVYEDITLASAEPQDTFVTHRITLKGEQVDD